MDIGKRAEELAIGLTSILSVVGTKEENNVVKRIYKFFGEMDYFKNNPENLKYVDVIDDEIGRKSTLATIKGKKGNSNKTVILIGHTDTVGITDYGDLKEYATKPLELIEKLKEVIIPEEARIDLDTGNYIFGRGIFDMKCGVAIIMTIMEELAKNVDNLEGNVIFAAVCDEEGNSGGMLSVVPELVRLKESEGYEYLAVIDTDYSAPRYVGDENRYVYIGTVGKLMPSFFIVGKETHVGEPYKGLDPNQISSSITKEFNLNMEYCDVAEGEVSLPPITLRQQDLKTEYSVQIAKTSYLYFNYATHISTPDEVMNRMLVGAFKAFQNTIDELNNQYKSYCKMSSYPYAELPWKARVITYEELVEKVRAEKGEELNLMLEKLNRELLDNDKIDERVFALKLVEQVHKMWSDKEPVVIAYFSPPYYPHIYVEGNEVKEKNLLRAVDDAIEAADNKFNIVRKKFYPYISDLSYAAAPKEDSIIGVLKENMPGFGVKYNLPLKEMQELNLPVVNIGPFGKDAHKFTERVERDYSFNVLPKMVYDTILNLLK
ncbi:M20/M25/M40 family metallo-hydrolase [Alkaliphilus sp. MSJ-5]|uniref:M20/M25/M40 family metallo-hydrolase n=1 Tax=Alkaliphilus flagellatus TaxID=2841507 RepID=A0ABS6G126_9FIRM|nr:M20/M25/M40 family metallo-hydrolase [Alkaliphilus flagellatus]MBU5676083.1 M20/M25/M40 family metallo-hydrolase [Alkaliphilus flagellatus]